MAGVACGFYEVRISRVSGGKEMIPEKYNKTTRLGVEVAPDAEWAVRGLRFELK